MASPNPYIKTFWSIGLQLWPIMCISWMAQSTGFVPESPTASGLKYDTQLLDPSDYWLIHINVNMNTEVRAFLFPAEDCKINHRC